jgi:hypothetical protein
LLPPWFGFDVGYFRASLNTKAVGCATVLPQQGLGITGKKT